MFQAHRLMAVLVAGDGFDPRRRAPSSSRKKFSAARPAAAPSGQEGGIVEIAAAPKDGPFDLTMAVAHREGGGARREAGSRRRSSAASRYRVENLIKQANADMATAAAAPSRDGSGWHVIHQLRHEFLGVLPPTLFFLAGFQLILFTKQLILANAVAFSGFMLATVAALIVGKAVLVADKMPFLRRFDRAPLIQPILFKTAVYCVFVLRGADDRSLCAFSLVDGNPPGAFLGSTSRAEFSWHRFLATQMWIFVLFLIYVTRFRTQRPVRRRRVAAHYFHRRASERQMTPGGSASASWCASAASPTPIRWTSPQSRLGHDHELVEIVERLARQRSYHCGLPTGRCGTLSTASYRLCLILFRRGGVQGQRRTPQPLQKGCSRSPSGDGLEPREPGGARRRCRGIRPGGST